MRHTHILTAALLLSVFFCSFELEAQSSHGHCIPVQDISGGRLAFAPGEALEYTVHYQWGIINSDVAMGYVTVDSTSLNGKPLYMMRVKGRTAKFYDPFFKVREDLKTWFSPETLQPERFTRVSKEGKYYANDEYRYIHSAAEPYIYASLDSKTKGKRQKNMAIEGCTIDIMALLATVRNLNLDAVNKGVRYKISFAFDDKVSLVVFVYEGRETVKVPGLGRVKAIKFGCQLTEGEQFNADSDMYMWLSDDGNRIPLRFEAPIKVGIVTGYLSAYSGLKHPFDSKKQ